MVLTHSRAVAAMLATCAVAVPVAGCGGSGGSGGGGDQKEIQALVEDFSAALLDTDGAKTCDLLTDKAINDLTGGDRAGCAKVIDGAGEPGDADKKQLANPKVTELKVDGDTATAKITTDGDSDPAGTQFKKVGGEWKIDGGA